MLKTKIVQVYSMRSDKLVEDNNHDWESMSQVMLRDKGNMHRGT